MDLDALKDTKKFFFYEFEDSINNIYIDTSLGLDAVNTTFYYFILCFIIFKERLWEKHCCIVAFSKLKMF